MFCRFCIENYKTNTYFSLSNDFWLAGVTGKATAPAHSFGFEDANTYEVKKKLLY